MKLITYISDKLTKELTVRSDLVLRSDNTNEIYLYILDELDTCVDISDAEILFTVKEEISDEDSLAILEKDVTVHENAQAGESKISLTPTDTADIYGNYFYSIRIVMSDDKVYTLAEGLITFKRDLTNRID